MRWLDKAINFYTEWNENDKGKAADLISVMRAIF